MLLKDHKGALWCSMTSKKNLCGLIKNSEACKWLLSERRCTNRSNWEFNQINLWLFDSRFFRNYQLPIFPRLQKGFELYKKSAVFIINKYFRNLGHVENDCPSFYAIPLKKINVQWPICLNNVSNCYHITQ